MMDALGRWPVALVLAVACCGQSETPAPRANAPAAKQKDARVPDARILDAQSPDAQIVKDAPKLDAYIDPWGGRPKQDPKVLAGKRKFAPGLIERKLFDHKVEASVRIRGATLTVTYIFCSGIWLDTFRKDFEEILNDLEISTLRCSDGYNTEYCLGAKC